MNLVSSEYSDINCSKINSVLCVIFVVKVVDIITANN